ncbi:MAG: hypothetical protein ACYTFZ_08480 [Planctomycetota bacterium]
MSRGRIRARIFTLLALGVLFTASQGCSSPGNVGIYLKHRAEDLLDTFDIGVTLSLWPGLAIYADAVSVAPGGIGYVDGWFVGLGGGQLGLTRHYEKSLGLLIWGYEEVGWGEFDKHDKDTLDRQFVGVAGILLPPYKGRPAYMPSCIHYLHVLCVGAVANARYMEMIDFVLGWSTLDIAGDDGYKLSKWPWMRRPDHLP